MTSKRVGGRPPAYSETQLIDAIDALEAGGAVPTAGLVKEFFINQFGLSTGINEQSLGAAVDEMLARRERQQRAALIASLSPQARQVGAEFARGASETFLVAMAREMATLRKASDAQLAEVDEDSKRQRGVIRALHEENHAKDTENAELRGRIRELEDDLAGARADISRLTTSLDVLRTESSQRIDRLIDAVERRVLDRPGGTGPGAAIQERAGSGSGRNQGARQPAVR